MPRLTSPSRFCRTVARSWRRARAVVAVSVVLCCLMAAGAGAASAAPARQGAAVGPPTGSYRNPVIPANAADPSVIRGLDGYYYLYATSTRLGNGATVHIFPIWRSADLVHWDYVGDAFGQVPPWVEGPQYLWAPDVHYFNGRYYLYYTADQARALPRYGTPAGVPAIGVATAPTPLGPWTDAGPPAGGSFAHGPLIPPHWGWCTDPASPSCYNWEFDSYVSTGTHGNRWLYEGSYFGGNRLHQLTASGLDVVPGSAVQYGHNIRYEASYLLPHEVGGTLYYYMLNSASDCCVGPDSPYSVVANRSTSPAGPFQDQNGAPMEWSYGPVHQLSPGESPFDNPIWWNLADEGGGSPVLKQNGNGIVGAGGQAVVTDLTGQDWLVYHGISTRQPWLDNGPPGDTSPLRQLFLDRLDWTAAGWPVVNDGNGPTWGGRAPVTTPALGDNFNTAGSGAPDYPGRARARWVTGSGAWHTSAGGPATGGYLTQTDPAGTALAVTGNQADPSPAGYQLGCDLRSQPGTGSYGCATLTPAHGPGAGGTGLAATVDPASHELILQQTVDGLPAGTPASASLPASFDPATWHHLVLKASPAGSGGATAAATAELETADGDPLGIAHLAIPPALPGQGTGIGLVTSGATADFDNVSLAPLAAATATMAAPPAPGTAVTSLSDSFGGHLGPQWSWLRPNPQLRGFAPDGALSLTTNGNLDEWQRLNLNATNPPDLPPTQNVLLEPPPSGDYMIETKMHFDPQTPNQEAGLIIYSDDDHNVQNDVTWNGTLTMVASIRNALSALPATLATCPLTAPMTGANVAITRYSHAACPPLAEHTSQEYPASLTCCWAGNGQGPSGSYPGGNKDPSHITVWLRIYRHGDIYTPWLSLNGSSWIRENAWTLQPSSPRFPIKIGLFAQDNQQTTAPGAQAWFDYVHVYHEP